MKSVLIKFAAGFCLLALLGGCSGVEKKRQLYRQSQSLAPLRVPVGLDMPSGHEVLPLPTVRPRLFKGGDAPFDATPPVNLPKDEESDSGGKG